MIVVHVHQRYELQRFELPDGEHRLGTVDGALPLLDLDAHCCTLQSRAVGCLILDVNGKTLVNGKPVAGLRALYKEDVVEIGNYRLIVEHVATAIDPVEQGLVDDILGGDPSAFLVYADWLEENGDARRASLLRAQEELLALELGDFEYQACAERLARLTTAVDQQWRLRLARGRVHGCYEEGCRMDWGSLAEIPHASASQRRCRACDQTVHYCEMVGDATAELRAGRRVVLDAAIVYDAVKFDVTIPR